MDLILFCQQLKTGLNKNSTLSFLSLTKPSLSFLTRNIMMSQALPENVLDGSLGIFIPYIFAEWTQIVINLAGNLY